MICQGNVEGAQGNPPKIPNRPHASLISFLQWSLVAAQEEFAFMKFQELEAYAKHIDVLQLGSTHWK